MKRRKFLLILSLALIAFSAYCLFTGAAVLEAPLYPGSRIPWGTLITWAGFVALPLTILAGFRELYAPATLWDRRFARFLRFLLYLAILWVPISYFLAGNASFSFTETDSFRGGQTAMHLFWIFNLVLAASPVLFMLVYLGLRITRK